MKKKSVKKLCFISLDVLVLIFLNPFRNEVIFVRHKFDGKI